jgi:ubiquinone/menaquinone biosynthesis C-methylase UbiE
MKKFNQEHADFYNNYYKTIQKNFTSWYRFMLPELERYLKKDSKLLEVGCGQSKGLRYLAEKELIKESCIFGIDQSEEAISFSEKSLPEANLSFGDAYNINFSDNTFDFVLLMEVIEHIEYPDVALKELYRVTKPNGKLFLSFPNYINLPWLIIRILAQLLNKPNWIVLQPVDKIYGTFNVISMCESTGFVYEKCIGTNYYPPIFYKYEKDGMTHFLNKIGMSHLSFHPVLVFTKKK